MNDTAAANLERIIEQSHELYSLPTVALQVLELTNNPKVDAAKLKACIERDPALTTKILRVVNSSLFGLKQQVSDLNQALALLGIKPLKLLVLGFSLPDSLFDDVAADVLNRYWKRTLTRAVAARELAERIWRVPGDEAFIAGLLADLGMLVLIQEVGQPYIDLLGKVSTAGDYLSAIERHALGFDHVQLTARLFARWSMPQTLVDAIVACGQGAQEPPRPTTSAAAALPDILRLADLLTLLLADERPEVLPLVLDTARRLRGVADPQIKTLVADMQEKIDQLADVLSLSLPDGLAYRDVLDLAHEKLVVVAADSAGDLMRAQMATVNAQLDQFKLLDEVRELSEAVSKLASPKRKNHGASRPVAARTAPSAATTRPLASAASGASPSSSSSTPAKTHARFEPTEVAPELLAHLSAAVGTCRQMRCALSLLLVEIDDWSDVVFSSGVIGAESYMDDFEEACRGIDHPEAICLGVRDARCALILVDCDRRQAVSLGNELINVMRARAEGAFTVSIGSATVVLPPRNFLPRDLVAAADRCLYGVRLAGGNTVKSIEIY